eukprot:3234053-Alexandrium_andersonii.AAC.1
MPGGAFLFSISPTRPAHLSSGGPDFIVLGAASSRGLDVRRVPRVRALFLLACVTSLAVKVQGGCTIPWMFGWSSLEYL